LFVLGYLVGFVLVQQVDDADSFKDVPQFDLWAVLVGGLVGAALAGVPFYLTWLGGLIRVSGGVRLGVLASWVAATVVVGSTPLTVLFLSAAGAPSTLDARVAADTRAVTLLVAICQAPALMTFLALRHVANTDALWTESAHCMMRLVLRLRSDLRRLLTVLGAFLTLLVVTTGMRRQAFVALDPETAIPPEAVLLYGLIFAVLLSAFYLIASGAIDARSERLLDRYAPTPDPDTDDFVGRLGRRNALASVIGSGGSWQTFQARVVIAAPLLTALIGTALGG
jgi:hypothetical protein